MISDITFEPCENSPYVKLSRMKYKLNGVNSTWDIAHVHDSVSILLYHKQRDALLLVKQLRPAVYLHNNDGYTYELCAGIVDKDKPLEVIAHEEIIEECGYEVPLEKIERVTSFYTSVGFAGSKQTLYFALIDESMRCSDGGGVEQEQIELVFLPCDQMEQFVFDESKAKTPGLMYAFHWFLSHKKDRSC